MLYLGSSKNCVKLKLNFWNLKKLYLIKKSNNKIKDIKILKNQHDVISEQTPYIQFSIFARSISV